MGWYVHIHVCFPCDENDGVAALARRHLEESQIGEDDGQREAKAFLESLSGRSGGNPGSKGGLSLWGMVGNYTRPEVFCEVLAPFWKDLLNGVPGGPLEHERIVVFCENEQSEAAEAYEIGWDDEYSPDRKIVVSVNKGLPFSWNQQ